MQEAAEVQLWPTAPEVMLEGIAMRSVLYTRTEAAEVAEIDVNSETERCEDRTLYERAVNTRRYTTCKGLALEGGPYPLKGPYFAGLRFDAETTSADRRLRTPT